MIIFVYSESNSQVEAQIKGKVVRVVACSSLALPEIVILTTPGEAKDNLLISITAEGDLMWVYHYATFSINRQWIIWVWSMLVLLPKLIPRYQRVKHLVAWQQVSQYIDDPWNSSLCCQLMFHYTTKIFVRAQKRPVRWSWVSPEQESPLV